MKRDKWNTIKIGNVYRYIGGREGTPLVVIVDYGNHPLWIGVKYIASDKYRQLQKAHLEVICE